MESLTGGEYYWMAGNYIKYGATNATGTVMTAEDMPVDSHELIAMCAPRLTFISYGVHLHAPGVYCSGDRGVQVSNVGVSVEYALARAIDAE